MEGLVSSPSYAYGDGTKEDVLRMIDLYDKDLAKLKNIKTRLEFIG